MGIVKKEKGKGQVTFKGRYIRIVPDFQTGILKSRGIWTGILQTKRPQMPV